MRIIVFLGPTLRVDEARAHLEASYRPPAIGGDVYACVREEPDVIAIIDGCFDQAPSVRHKEVLFALSKGVHVYGAASMGALRAAEMHQFGMIGVGRVFEAFRSGELEDDDEVAVEHAAAEYDFRELSDAMVNIRHGLAVARGRGLITTEIEQTLTTLAKRRFYPDRKWPDLLDEAAAHVSPEPLAALRAMIYEERPSLKRDDAVELLQTIARVTAEGLEPHRPCFEFQATPIWHRTKLAVDRRFE